MATSQRLSLAAAAKRREAHHARRAALASRRATRRRLRLRVSLGLLTLFAGAVAAVNAVGLSRFESLQHWAWLEGAPGAVAHRSGANATATMASVTPGGAAAMPQAAVVADGAAPASTGQPAQVALLQANLPGTAGGDAGNLTSGAAAMGGDSSFRNSQGREGAGSVRQSQVSERDLGISFMPGSQMLPQESSRVQDADSGTTSMAALVTQAPLDKVLAYYRSQLGKAATAGQAMEEVQPGPGQVLMSVVDPSTGAHQAVWIGQEGGQVLVRMVRAQPSAVPPPGAPPASGDAPS